MLMTNLHYARAFLNPYLLGEVCLHDDVDAKEASNTVLRKIISTPTTYALVLRDFANFVESQGPFSNTPPNERPRLAPNKWWDLIGVGGRTFAPITYHILAQMCFTPSCEWNWNSYSFVHNKMRNWLTSNLAEDLVCIYTNSKLLL